MTIETAHLLLLTWDVRPGMYTTRFTKDKKMSGPSKLRIGNLVCVKKHKLQGKIVGIIKTRSNLHTYVVEFNSGVQDRFRRGQLQKRSS